MHACMYINACVIMEKDDIGIIEKKNNCFFLENITAAKPQAPAPPQQSSTSSGSMIQLKTSPGVKQWQHNAASSAC